jgi:hypothetical protein
VLLCLFFFRSLELCQSYSQEEEEEEGMYYGGPYKELAGTVPTCTCPMYATVVNGPVRLWKHKHL